MITIWYTRLVLHHCRPPSQYVTSLRSKTWYTGQQHNTLQHRQKTLTIVRTFEILFGVPSSSLQKGPPHTNFHQAGTNSEKVGHWFHQYTWLEKNVDPTMQVLLLSRDYRHSFCHRLCEVTPRPKSASKCPSQWEKRKQENPGWPQQKKERNRNRMTLSIPLDDGSHREQVPNLKPWSLEDFSWRGTWEWRRWGWTGIGTNSVGKKPNW